MAIQRMGFYEAWMHEVKKVVFALCFVVGLLIVSVAYAISIILV